MLIKYSLSHNIEDLKKIIKTDTEPFESFKSKGIEKEILIVGATLQKSEVANPTLSVYIINQMVPADIKETIAILWQEVCNTYSTELSDCYVENMPIKVYQYHELYYNIFTRANKENISAILRDKYNIIPKNIFASSTGYLTLVYEESNYTKIENDIEDIKSLIIIFTKNTMLNELGVDNLPNLKINIFHNKMSVDLYGYSRED